jgi:hypothetical protein
MKTFVSDIVTDLIEKRLWPLALALIVALVALPVLMTRGGADVPSTSPAPGAPAATAGATTPAANAALVRLDTAPAVARKRSVRLRNPFAGAGAPSPAPATPPSTTGAATSGSESTASAASAGSGSSAADAAPSAAGAVPAIGDTSVSTPVPSSTPTSSGTGHSTPTATTTSPSPESDDDAPVSYSVTLRFGPTDGTRRTLRNVARLTVLPDSDNAVVGLLGVLRDGRTASFVLSPKVTASGNGTCRPSKQDCKTVELRGGDAEYLRVTGADGQPDTWYYLEVLHVDRRRASSARQAAAAYARRSGAGAAVIRKAASSVRHVRYLPARGVLVRARRSAGGQAAASAAAGLVPLLPAPEQPGIAVWRSRKPAPSPS